MERCHSTLLVRYLTVWQHRLQRTRQLAEFEQLVAERGVRAVKRRTLSHWRHCITLNTTLTNCVLCSSIVTVNITCCVVESLTLACLKMWSWNCTAGIRHKFLQHTITLH